MSPTNDTAWYDNDEARALLADITANPPALVERMAPIASVMAGGPETILEYDDWSDERGFELRRMSEKALRRAELACSTSAERRELFRRWKGHQEVIRDAVAAARMGRAA